MSDLVPDGWLHSRLGEHVKFSQGVQVDVSEQLKTRAENYIRFIRIVDYTQNTTDIRYVHESNATKGVVEYDEVVMVRYGATGFIGRGISGVIANNMFSVTPNDLISKDFLYQYLSSDRIQDFIQSLVASSTMPALNFSGVSTIPLYLPLLPEQQKIAKILTSVDEVIEKTQAQVDKLKDLKTGMMQELLTNGIGHTEFKDSPVGRIPAEWEVVRVNELVTKVGSGVTPKGGSKAYVSTGIPLIRSQNVHSDGLRLDNVSFITDKQHQKMKGSQLQPNDVLLNITGASIGRCYYLADDFVEGNVNQHVCIIRLKRNMISHVFLTLLLNGQFGQSQIMSLQAGGNREGLNFQQIREIKLPLPSLKEQIKISNALSSVESKIRSNQSKLTTIKNTKKALMQDLLTGNVRVKL